MTMLVNKVGVFCILLGISLIGLFILSDVARTPQFWYLLAGAALVILGMVLWWKDPPQPAPPADRFRMLRKKPPQERGDRSKKPAKDGKK